MSINLDKLKEEIDGLDKFRIQFDGRLHVTGTNRVFEIVRSLIADLAAAEEKLDVMHDCAVELRDVLYADWKEANGE